METAKLRNTMNTRVGLLIRVILLAFFGWLIVRHMKLAELRALFASLNLTYLFAGIAIFCPLDLLLRALKWRFLFPSSVERPGVLSFVRAYAVGVLANAALFSKLGDLVKAEMVCNERMDYGRSLAIVVVDRLIEAIALLAIFSLALLESKGPAWAYRLAWIGALASGGALAGLHLLWHRPELFLGFVGSVTGLAPIRFRQPCRLFVHRLAMGCEVLTSYRRVFGSFGYALTVWVTDAGMMAMIFKALALPIPYLTAAIVVLAVVNFGVLVPVSPGSVGVYQVLVALTLALWGVGHGLGFTAGIVAQAATYVPVYLLGLICVLRFKCEDSSRPGDATLERSICELEA